MKVINWEGNGNFKRYSVITHVAYTLKLLCIRKGHILHVSDDLLYILDNLIIKYLLLTFLNLYQMPMLVA